MNDVVLPALSLSVYFCVLIVEVYVLVPGCSAQLLKGSTQFTVTVLSFFVHVVESPDFVYVGGVLSIGTLILIIDL